MTIRQDYLLLDSKTGASLEETIRDAGECAAILQVAVVVSWQGQQVRMGVGDDPVVALRRWSANLVHSIKDIQAVPDGAESRRDTVSFGFDVCMVWTCPICRRKYMTKRPDPRTDDLAETFTCFDCGTFRGVYDANLEWNASAPS